METSLRPTEDLHAGTALDDDHPPDPDRTYAAFATKLPLTAHRYIPGFLRDTLRIRRPAAATPGLIGYGLLAELLAKTFWTVSVWEDEASLRAFAGSEPHRSIMRRVPARMGDSAFRRSRSPAPMSRSRGPTSQARVVVTERPPSRYHHGNLAAAAVAAAEAEIAATASPRPACAGSPTGPASATRRSASVRRQGRPARGRRRRGLPRARRALGGGGPDMRALGRAYVEFAEQRPALFAVMFQPTVYRADDPGVVAARARTTALLRAGVGQPADEPDGRRRHRGVGVRARDRLAGARGRHRGRAVELYERRPSALFPAGPPSV